MASLIAAGSGRHLTASTARRRLLVVASTPELRDAFANPLSEGFWKCAPPTLGGGQFRLVNNTQSCIGPCLIIYNGVPPAHLDFAQLGGKELIVAENHTLGTILAQQNKPKCKHIKG